MCSALEKEVKSLKERNGVCEVNGQWRRCAELLRVVGQAEMNKQILATQIPDK